MELTSLKKLNFLLKILYKEHMKKRDTWGFSEIKLPNYYPKISKKFPLIPIIVYRKNTKLRLRMP